MPRVFHDGGIGNEERAWKHTMSYLCQGYAVFDILKDGERMYGEKEILDRMAKQYRVISLWR